jgi:hypothetical protein
VLCLVSIDIDTEDTRDSIKVIVSEELRLDCTSNIFVNRNPPKLGGFSAGLTGLNRPSSKRRHAPLFYTVDISKTSPLPFVVVCKL